MQTKCRLRLALATVVIVLVATSVRPAGAAPACDNLIPSVTFRLIAAHPTVTEEVIATSEQMDEAATRIGTTTAARKAHPLMLITAQAGSHVELDHRPIEGRTAAGEAYFCDVPPSITVTVGAFKQRIFLHHEAAAIPCVRDALRQHQRRHSQLLDATINSFVNEHRDALERHVWELMRKTAPDALSVIKALEAGLASSLGRLHREFQIAVERAREEADSPSALDQLQSICDGKLRQLELELGTLSGRRALRR